MRDVWSSLADRLWPAALGPVSRFVIEPMFGTRQLTIARWLPSYWLLSEAERRAWQSSRLNTTLEHVTANIPFYRGFSADPTHVDRFPLVDKATIKADPDAFATSQPLRTIRKRTGGSTGDPWIYDLDRLAFSYMYGAQLAEFERLGYRYGQRRLYLGAPTSLGLDSIGPVKSVRLLLERNDPTLTGFDISRSHSLARVVRAADRSATLWYGYASTLAAMAEAVTDERLPVNGPKLIVTMAERLEPAWRTNLEQAFPTTTVVEEYGCNDGGVLAHSCRDGLLHLADSISMVEVLDDDRPCQPGEEGEITVTNLHARSLPFIRYQVGDRAVVGPHQCPCGRPGPTLEQVTGRSGDRVTLASGMSLPTSAFTQMFKKTPDVRRWQIIQPSLDRLEVRLETAEGFDDGQRAIIHDYLVQLTDGEAAPTIVTTMPMLRTAGGKHRVIVGERSFAENHEADNQKQNQHQDRSVEHD